MSEISRGAAVSSRRIIDAPKVMGQLALSILFLFVGFLGKEAVSLPEGSLLALGIVLLPFAPIMFWRFAVNAPGYVIDVENDTFKFPGGGIEANSWLSYLNPMHWLQGFWRHKVVLSEIRYAQTYVDESISQSTNSYGKVSTKIKKKNILEISGDFGAIQFTFSSKGKRDQLYSAIVSINQMGAPIVGQGR